MIFDIHGDIWTDVTLKRSKGQKHIIRDNHLKRFKKGNMVGGIFVIWADPPHDLTPRKRLLESVKYMSSELWENQDILKPTYNSKDFYDAIETNRLAILLGLEGLSAIGEDVEFLYTLYQLGFRHCSLTWNEENLLATGVLGSPNRGLTTSGKSAIKIIEDLGMILDVSHANDKTFWDICENSTKPFIASHSNSRTLCNEKRNLTDEQIKAIGEKNGLIGINGYNGFVSTNNKDRTVEKLVDHIDYIVNLIGINKISLGFDFFEYLEDDTMNNLVKDKYVGTKGIEDISKCNNLIKLLENRGYTKDDIEKISYKNFINLMDKVMK